MIEFVVLTLGAATCGLGVFLIRKEIAAGQNDAMRAVMKTDETAKSARRMVREVVRRSIEMRREISDVSAAILALEVAITESRNKLNQSDTRISWLLVLGERKSSSSDIPYAVEVRDQRNGERQKFMVWEENKDRARKRVVRRFPVSAGFEVGEAESLRSPPPSVNT